MLNGMDPRTERQNRRDVVARMTADREARGRNKKGASRWRRWRRRVGAVLIELLAPVVVRLLALTWRIERAGERGLAMISTSGPWIVPMWHGRMLAAMPVPRHHGRGIGVLVSPSDDGGLVIRVLRSFRFKVVRGSLSRAGAQALRDMSELLESGGQLVVTPDGPRGPRHSMNVGIAWLARATGAPIVPLGVAVSRAWRLRSWDRFVIPKPFARLVVFYGDPVVIRSDADDAELERTAQGVRTTLLAGERAAFARLGVPDDLEQ